MVGPTWEHAEAVLADALDQPSGERDVFVREHCPDPALLVEVRLLQNEAAPDCLGARRRGSADAEAELMDLVYPELRMLAAAAATGPLGEPRILLWNCRTHDEVGARGSGEAKARGQA